MYLDCTIKIPDSNGKITKKTIKGTTYIYYTETDMYRQAGSWPVCTHVAE